VQQKSVVEKSGCDGKYKEFRVEDFHCNALRFFGMLSPMRNAGSSCLMIFTANKMKVVQA